MYRPPLWLAATNGRPALLVHAVQYAWIGTGFGWNVAASATEEPERWFILGTVYHVEGGAPHRIRVHRPHVGVAAGPERLLWLTREEAFLEEIHEAGNKDEH